ncbi:MAG TPA: protein-L-isoaspartate(D-aspartate) O-methyltransferase [Bryobacteraceae bacterium]|nr:protein-L-isoaspartate(D-aspartate) O-methyltransferase [Bryobacteraceae bacterium]
MRAIVPILLLFIAAQDRNTELRERMVQRQIEDRGITDPRVLETMRQVPRHLFMPEEVRSAAYQDSPVPIGRGQTISQPYIVAFMTDLLKTRPSDIVLEIGTGSGYQAAVLARLAKHVYTIEIVPDLARSATSTLDRLGYANVTVRVGDGYKGWPERAPFDRIILTAAPPELPQALIDQLKPGGRLVAPVGRSWDQELIVIEKAPDGKLKRRSALPVRFVPMVKPPR